MIKDDKGYPTVKELLTIIERQVYKCALSGVEIDPRRSSLDHKNPRSLGGPSDVDNLQVVLPVINRAKGTNNNDQYISMCWAVARNNPDPGDTTWMYGLIE